MARPARLSFRSVDTATTSAGQILEAANLWNGTGVGWKSPRHYSSRALVLLVRGGGIYRDTRGFTAPIHPGHLILVNPKVGHTYGPSDPENLWDEFYVSYEGPVFDALDQDRLPNMHMPVIPLGDPSPWRKELEAIFPPASRRVYAPVQHGALVAFLLKAYSLSRRLTPNSSPAWLEPARKQLEMPGAGAPSLKGIASTCGLSYEAFRKQFTALTGHAPMRFRLYAYIAHGQRLMRESNLPDRAIAEALGFCDEFHFSKTFKRITGSSPRVWRARHMAWSRPQGGVPPRTD